MSNSGISENMWATLKSRFASSRKAMLQSGQLSLNGRTMNFVYKTKGSRPSNGYSLIFGLHGGGGCAADVNDGQYNNHKNLYNNQLPDGSIWVAPRAIQDAWDMWFKDYLEDFILEITHAFVINDLVDPNRVFLTGYSAGGDGVYHLAPRMADFLAGAAMMAGHPNQTQLLNLRNIKFSIQVGGDDNAYNRVNEAIKCSRMVAQLAQNYGGYENQCKIIQNKPHWMDKQDSNIFPWLFNAVRNPYPDVILFKQCDRRKKSTFYYLRFADTSSDEQTLVLKQGNLFKIFSNNRVTVLLNQKMINPNQPITIVHNGQPTAQRQFQSRPEIAQKTMLERIDPYYIFEDQIQSSPQNRIDVKAAICQEFRISRAEKDAEFQKGLPKKVEQTPANWSKSMAPLVHRTAQLPSNIINGIGGIFSGQGQNNNQNNGQNWGFNQDQNQGWNNNQQQQQWNNQNQQQQWNSSRGQNQQWSRSQQQQRISQYQNQQQHNGSGQQQCTIF